MSNANQARTKSDQPLPPDASTEAKQADHVARLHEAEKKRKAENVVVEQWLDVIPDKTHQKGDKYRLCKRMKNGTVYRHYLGRHQQVADVVNEYKKKGLKVR